MFTKNIKAILAIALMLNIVLSTPIFAAEIDGYSTLPDTSSTTEEIKPAPLSEELPQTKEAEPISSSDTEKVEDNVDDSEPLTSSSEEIDLDGRKADDSDTVTAYNEYFAVERIWKNEHNEKISIQDGNRLIGLDENNEKTVLFETSGTITDLRVNSELAFFRVDDTIYRLHIESGIVDDFYTNVDMVRFYPESNQKIIYTKYTPEALEYIADGGHAYDPDVEIRWHTAFEFDFTTKSEQEYVSDSSPIGTDLTVSDSTIITPQSTDLKAFDPVKINKKIIPHPSYGIGATGASWPKANTCVAHAKFIYNYIWGDVSYGTAVYDKDISKNETESTLGTQFGKLVKSLKLGARMTLYRDDGTSHTFVIVARGADNFTVYHSNYGNKNKVTITRFTYKEVAKKFATTSYYNPKK